LINEMLMLGNLNCPTCAAKLEKAAQALPGMKSARVVFGAGSLNVEYDPHILSQEKIRNLCRQMGVDVVAVVPGRNS